MSPRLTIAVALTVLIFVLGSNGYPLIQKQQRRNGVCDPLVPESCLLPFPNNFYTQTDPKTPTGLRVVFPDEAAFLDRQGNGFSFEKWSRLDGFSISTTIMALFPNVSLSNSNVPGWENLAASLASDCPTILLDTVTGERLAHFSELDETTLNSEKKAFMIWPTQQLTESRRYVVAIRGLRDSNNNLIQPSSAFLALRDGVPSEDPDVENRRELFEDIFSILQVNGVRRRDLILAWDFTVGSEKYTTGAMLTVRDDSKNRIPSGGPTYKIKEVIENFSTRIARKVVAEMTVPHYLTKNARPGSELVLDEDGYPVYQGEVDVEFTVLFPYKCTSAGSKCPILVYGHGLLGTQSQLEGGTQQDVANNYGYVLCAVDMWGMSSPDVATIFLKLLNDLGGVNIIPDRSTQGMLNQLLLMKVMAGNFASDPAAQFNGESVIDVTRKYYWGISQGGILGAVYVAVSEDVQVGHLGVPGAPYPLLLARSVDFDPYFNVIKGRYTDPVDRILSLSLIGLLWDRAEPSGFLNLLKRDPNKRVLIDYAKGDAQVSYLGAYFMARSINAKAYVNNVSCRNETVPIYGIEVTDGSVGPVTQGSIMIGFDYGVSCGPVTNTPPEKETDTHGKPRNDKRNQDNMNSFFRYGEIYDICEGQGCYSN